MYYFLLRTETGSEGAYLPMNPESLEITAGVKNESYHLMNLGERVNPGAPLCRSIAFSSVLPPSSAPSAVLERWQRYMAQKTVLRLIVGGDEPWGEPRFELNFPCVLEKIKYTEKGGEPGSVFFDMVLKEYRPFSLKVIS